MDQIYFTLYFMVENIVLYGEYDCAAPYIWCKKSPLRTGLALGLLLALPVMPCNLGSSDLSASSYS